MTNDKQDPDAATRQTQRLVPAPEQREELSQPEEKWRRKPRFMTRPWRTMIAYSTMEEAIITRNAARGWMIQDVIKRRFFSARQRFREDAPQKIRTRIVYMRLGNHERYEAYVNKAQRAGWEWIGCNVRDCTIFISRDLEGEPLPLPPGTDIKHIMDNQFKYTAIYCALVVLMLLASFYGMITDPAFFTPNEGNLHILVVLLGALASYAFINDLILMWRAKRSIEQDRALKKLEIKSYYAFKAVFTFAFLAALVYWSNGLTNGIARTVVEPGPLPAAYQGYVASYDTDTTAEYYTAGNSIVAKDTVCFRRELADGGEALSYTTTFRAEFMRELWLKSRLKKQTSAANPSLIYYFPPNAAPGEGYTIYTFQEGGNVAAALIKGASVTYYHQTSGGEKLTAEEIAADLLTLTPARDISPL